VSQPETPERIGLGVDIGGTGLKAGLVDLDTGKLVGERVRTPTPQPATFAALTSAVTKLAGPLLESVESVEAIGVGFPAVVRRGVALSAVNVSAEWMYSDVGKVFSEAFGRPVWALNDSDAAAFAEARFGAGRHQGGTILVATLGTGVGTGLVVEGQLVPNIELGMLTVRDKPAGQRVANSVRKRKKLSWTEWAADLQAFVDALDEAVAPDLVIIGGGVSDDAHRYLPLIRTRPMVVPARLRNDAGIVGAATYAADQQIRRAQSESGTISQLAPTERTPEEGEEPPAPITPLRGTG
jgi:polyphosphate glucokinase